MNAGADAWRTSRESPYKGLAPYSADDSPFFFGRERERDVVIANLRARQLTVIYGASGVGKSSLLHAGVLSELRRQARDEVQEHQTAEFVPVVFGAWRDDPVEGLLEAVRASANELLPKRELRKPAKANIAETLGSWAGELECEFLIILDQFEEYFLYHVQESGDGTFDAELPRALNSRDLAASFLIAIREDAFAKLDRFKNRVPDLLDNYLRIGHLDERSAREAIERPLEIWNRTVGEGEKIEIEAALVKAVLDEVRSGIRPAEQAGHGVIEPKGRADGDERVEAPYLQLVMTRLWEEETRQGSQLLRAETLIRLGGAERIVQNHLDEALGALPRDEQELAAGVFYYLVTPDGTKIAQSVETLAAYSRNPVKSVEAVLEKLATGSVRIVRPVAPPPGSGGGLRYEIFHDVLAPAILDWRSRIERVKLEHQREQAEKERQEAQRQERVQRRRAREFRALAVLFGLMFIVAGALGIWALHQKNVAQAERAGRQSRALVAGAWTNMESDPELSLLLARRALATRHTPEAEEALRESLMASHVRAAYRGHQNAVNTAAFNPAGTTLVTASDDETARLWQTASGKPLKVLRGHTSYVSSAAFSPDGKEIVTASWDRSARIWSTGSGKTIRELRGHENAVNWAAFSPDGQEVVTASRDRTARIWSASTGRTRTVLRGHTEKLNTAEFSPDGRLVVTSADDHTARIWSAATGRQVRVLRGHTDYVNSAEFSRDGRFVVTASSDGSARIWDVKSGVSIKTLPHHGDRVTSASFSRDGEHVVTTTLNEWTVRVWEAATGRNTLVLRGHFGPVLGAAFSPKGNFIASASSDHTARLWSVPPKPATLRHPESVFSAAFSPDGKSVVTGSSDGAARVWTVSHPHTSAVLRSPYPVPDAAFSRDGRSVLTAGADGLARLWRLDTRRVTRMLKPGLPRGAEPRVVVSVDFSPDGRSALTAEWDGDAAGVARIFDLASGRQTVVLRGPKSKVNQAVYSPDGRSVATANDDGTARVFNAATGKQIELLREGMALRGQTPLRGVGFSPDGKVLAAVGETGSAKLWDVRRGFKIANLFGPKADVESVVFSPDGRLITTTTADGAVQLWDRATKRSLGTLLTQDGDVRKAAFSPDQNLVVTAGRDDGTARIIRCEVCGPIGSLERLASTRVTRGLSSQERSLYLGKASG